MEEADYNYILLFQVEISARKENAAEKLKVLFWLGWSRKVFLEKWPIGGAV